MARIFISSAREDLSLAGDVHRWLVENGHDVSMDQDSQERIVVGERRRAQVHKRLQWADAVICVVTSATIGSSRCTTEIATALAKGKRLLPLSAEPDVVHPLLADFQHIDLTQDSTAARAALTTEIRRIDTARGHDWPRDRSPFPGMRPFDVDQHQVFFGRTEEIKALTELVCSSTGDRALLVMGPSGCGKSSLVRAGLLPMMATVPGWRTLPPLLPGADPVAALARELAAAARRLGLDWNTKQVHQQFDAGGLTLLVDELLLADPDGPQRRLLIVVDQFEELLTQAAPEQRARFAALLRPALAHPIRVVGTMRTEFLDQLLADPGLAVLGQAQVYPLRPLRREAIRSIIEGPTRLAGIDVDAALLERLIADTGTGEALPLLAFTLARLTEGVDRGDRLEAARYDQLGGVQGALTRQADAALAAAVTARGRSREEVIATLLRLVTLDEEGRPTRWRIDWAELPEQVIADLDAFVTRRLLTTDTDNGTVVISVAHEAFLSAWPPLAEAITANKSALRAQRAIEHAAVEWREHGSSPRRLWAGGQLAAAMTDIGARLRSGAPYPMRQRRTLSTTRVEVSAKARDFLLASIRRDRFRRRRMITALSVLLVLALAGASIAVVFLRITQDRERVATAGRLVGEAEAARDTDLDAALLRGLAAHRLQPDRNTRSSLVNTLTAGPYIGTLTGHQGTVESMAFSPDGRTLATSSDDDTVILWDLTKPTQPRQIGQPLAGHSTIVKSVTFSPDGRILASGGDKKTILWDVRDPAQPHRLGPAPTGHSDLVNAVAFAPDGRTLATGTEDKTVILWDVTDPAQPRQLGSPLTGHTGPVNAVALTPDGRAMITSDADRTVILWDVTDPAHPSQIGQPLTLTSTLDIPAPPQLMSPQNRPTALAPDGHTLATNVYDITPTLWDVTNRFHPRRLGSRLPIIADSTTAMSFAPRGGMLATSGPKGTILWDVTDPTKPYPLGPPLTGHTTRVNAVVFSPDGHTLAVGGDDGNVILWDLTDPAQPQHLGLPLSDHDGPVRAMAFAPDSHILATGSADGSVILWDLADPARPRRLGPPLTGHRGWVWSLAFAPDGHTLATGSIDSTVILWNLTDPTHPRRLKPLPNAHNLPLTSVAFAPGGRILATGVGGAVILWDVTNLDQPRQLELPLIGQDGVGNAVVFSPEGRTLATGRADGTVILWDLSNLDRPRELGPPLTGHTSPVTSVAFSPDGRTLATSSADGTANLWDLSDPAQPRRLGGALPNSHTNPVISVAFSPDGRTLVTGSGETLLWDLTEPGQPSRLGAPLPYTDGAFGAWAVAFSPDGRTLAIGDGPRVRLWHLSAVYQVRDSPVERACAITHGGLNRDEWDRYVPGLPYRDTCPH